VALYDPKKDTLSSPFFKDEFDEIKQWPAQKSLTGMVVYENRALLLQQQDVEKLELEGKLHRLGGRSQCWLGVPLRSEGKAIGAFVVQSYHDKNAYSKIDLELLEFVSNQISVTLRRKKDEEEIALLSKSIAQSPVSIVITDTSGKIEYVNPKFTQVTGYSSDEAIGQKPNILKSGTQKSEIYTALWQALKTGKQWTGELHNKKKDGTFFWEFASISPIVDPLGKVHHYLAVKEDITERKNAQERTSNLTSRLTTLIANLPSGILLETPQRKIQQTNLKFCELFGIGLSPDELVGFDCIEASDSAKFMFSDPELFNDRIEQILAEKKPVLNEELQLKDGRVFQRDFVPIRTADQEFENLWHYRDITHQKKAEHDLKQQASLQKILMDISSKYINMPVAQIESEIMTSLKELALFVEADRAYVFNYDWTNQVASNTHEWTGNGISSYKDELQNISLLNMYNWVEAHTKGLTIIIHDSLTLANDDFLKQILLDHEVKSLIAIPMMNDGQCIGFVGFDSVKSLHTYTEAEEILLSVFSEMLVNVRHRATLEKNLIAEKQNADNASKAKSEFLANMSHEIRTPLNGVIGFTDLLLKTALNKTQLEYAENANISGISLLGIINDILDFSKIEAGKMELDLIKTDIIELVEQASDIIKYHAAKKGLELLLNINPNIPRFAVVDPVRLKQILVNLLGNAIKFTEAGEVEIKLTFVENDASSGQFRFSVRDTGIGISEDQQNKLFSAFTQADTTTTRKFGGTGLGLTISNMLAKKMGGEIQIVSAKGKGSNFFFTVETEYEVGEKLETNNSELKLKRVLVIDDNDNNRLILEHTFDNWGIEFSGIDNGLSAIKLISHSKPFDLIIIDYHMPFLNGIDTIKMIREKLQLSPQILPIILLHSSSDDMEIYEECKKLGVRFNLTKPIKSQELFHYLKNIHNHPDFLNTKDEPKDASPVTIENTIKPKPMILIAEDVMLNRILITTLIRQMVPNVEILEATNGQEALDLFIIGKPALIFMDIQMPEMDGIEATMEIRRLEKGNGHVPIVALTAGSIKGEEEKCMRAGMDSFLTKPIVQKELVLVLEKYLSEISAKPTTKE
ncbi:MAG: response regulator, partial [Bacteroidales bacterium]